jgi:hypothetical protein
MKTILSIAVCVMCYSCFPAREVQAELVYATLVKVEEVNRYPNLKQKILTWQTDKEISFVTYEKSSINIPIGTQTRVLMTK